MNECQFLIKGVKKIDQLFGELNDLYFQLLNTSETKRKYLEEIAIPRIKEEINFQISKNIKEIEGVLLKRKYER